jgi:hypothetical protein
MVMAVNSLRINLSTILGPIQGKYYPDWFGASQIAEGTGLG